MLKAKKNRQVRICSDLYQKWRDCRPDEESFSTAMVRACALRFFLEGLQGKHQEPQVQFGNVWLGKSWQIPQSSQRWLASLYLPRALDVQKDDWLEVALHNYVICLEVFKKEHPNTVRPLSLVFLVRGERKHFYLPN